MKPDSTRVIADLKELAALTTDERGAQRVAWGPVWRKTREWFTAKLKNELGLVPTRDGAGNLWATLPGKSTKSVVLGSHLDSVPGGGWLDGCLGVLAGLEVLRREKAKGIPPLTIHLVDWADEEGARFGRSLMGSAASAGMFDSQANLKELEHLVDRNGVKLPDALNENGITLEGIGSARRVRRAGARPRQAAGSPAPTLRGLRLFGRREDFEVELLVELLHLALRAGGEEFASHRHQRAVVAGGVLDQHRHQLGRHQLRVAGLHQHMTQRVEHLIGSGSLEGEPHAHPAAQREKFLGAQPLDESAITGQHRGEQQVRVEAGAAHQPQLIQD
jgi:hypothetical protein